MNLNKDLIPSRNQISPLTSLTHRIQRTEQNALSPLPQNDVNHVLKTNATPIQPADSANQMKSFRSSIDSQKTINKNVINIHLQDEEELSINKSKKVRPQKFAFNKPYNMQKLVVKNRRVDNDSITDIGFRIAPNAQSQKGFTKPMGVKKSFGPMTTKNQSTQKFSTPSLSQIFNINTQSDQLAEQTSNMNERLEMMDKHTPQNALNGLLVHAPVKRKFVNRVIMEAPSINEQDENQLLNNQNPQVGYRFRGNPVNKTFRKLQQGHQMVDKSQKINDPQEQLKRQEAFDELQRLQMIKKQQAKIEKQQDLKKAIQALADAAEICKEGAGFSIRKVEDEKKPRINLDLEDIQYQHSNVSISGKDGQNQTIDSHDPLIMTDDSKDNLQQKSVRFEDQVEKLTFGTGTQSRDKLITDGNKNNNFAPVLSKKMVGQGIQTSETLAQDSLTENYQNQVKDIEKTMISSSKKLEDEHSHVEAINSQNQSMNQTQQIPKTGGQELADTTKSGFNIKILDKNYKRQSIESAAKQQNGNNNSLQPASRPVSIDEMTTQYLKSEAKQTEIMSPFSPQDTSQNTPLVGKPFDRMRMAIVNENEPNNSTRQKNDSILSLSGQVEATEKQLIQVLNIPQSQNGNLDVIQENSKESKAADRSKIQQTENSLQRESSKSNTLLHHKSVEQFAESIGIPVKPSPMEDPQPDVKLDEMIKAYKMQLGIPVPVEERYRVNKVTSSAVYINRKAHQIIDYTNCFGSNTESMQKMQFQHQQYKPFRAKKPKIENILSMDQSILNEDTQITSKQSSPKTFLVQKKSPGGFEYEQNQKQSFVINTQASQDKLVNNLVLNQIASTSSFKGLQDKILHQQNSIDKLEQQQYLKEFNEKQISQGPKLQNEILKNSTGTQALTNLSQQEGSLQEKIQGAQVRMHKLFNEWNQINDKSHSITLGQSSKNTSPSKPQKKIKKFYGRPNHRHAIFTKDMSAQIESEIAFDTEGNPESGVSSAAGYFVTCKAPQNVSTGIQQQNFPKQNYKTPHVNILGLHEIHEEATGVLTAARQSLTADDISPLDSLKIQDSIYKNNKPFLGQKQDSFLASIKSRNQQLPDSPYTDGESKTFQPPSPNEMSISPKADKTSQPDFIGNYAGSKKMLPRFNQGGNMMISEAPSSISSKSKSPCHSNRSFKNLPIKSPNMEDQIDNFIVQANSYLSKKQADSPLQKDTTLASRLNPNSPLKNHNQYFKIQHRVNTKPPSQLKSGDKLAAHRQFKPMRESLPSITKKSPVSGSGSVSISQTLAELQSLEKQRLSIHVKGIGAAGELSKNTKLQKNPMASKFMHIVSDSTAEENESDLFSSSTKYQPGSTHDARQPAQIAGKMNNAAENTKSPKKVEQPKSILASIAGGGDLGKTQQSTIGDFLQKYSLIQEQEQQLDQLKKYENILKDKIDKFKQASYFKQQEMQQKLLVQVSSSKQKLHSQETHQLLENQQQNIFEVRTNLDVDDRIQQIIQSQIESAETKLLEQNYQKQISIQPVNDYNQQSSLPPLGSFGSFNLQEISNFLPQNKSNIINSTNRAILNSQINNNINLDKIKVKKSFPSFDLNLNNPISPQNKNISSGLFSPLGLTPCLSNGSDSFNRASVSNLSKLPEQSFNLNQKTSYQKYSKLKQKRHQDRLLQMDHFQKSIRKQHQL